MNPRLVRAIAVTAMVLRHSRRNYRIDVSVWHAPHSDRYEAVEIWCRNGTSDSLAFWLTDDGTLRHRVLRQPQFGADGIDNAPIYLRKEQPFEQPVN